MDISLKIVGSLNKSTGNERDTKHILLPITIIHILY